ncbi:MAG TPA: hypothetical protein VKA04_08780 [Pseudodesulfovibrio sp.]|nr:hypothetical protein [Pseudodesulfovibrio sp.]
MVLLNAMTDVKRTCNAMSLAGPCFLLGYRMSEIMQAAPRQVGTDLGKGGYGV